MPFTRAGARNIPCAYARLFLFLLLVTLDVTMRIAGSGLNSTPLVASALLAAYVFERRSVALGVPLLAMAISDAWLGVYDVRIMLSVYLSLAFPLLLRPFLRRGLHPVRLAGASLLASATFYLVTNLAVWAFSPLYPHTPQGLLECYAAGVPFMKYAVVGDLVWVGLLFGAWVAVRERTPASGLAKTPAH